jgi:hypothetical protein
LASSNDTRRRIAALCGGAAIGCVFALPAFANGDTFFQSKEVPGAAEFVLFGSVKDMQGKYLDKATVTVTVPVHQVEFSVETDILGRFRTPDIGRAVRELGYEVDPSLILISVEYRNYRLVRREYRGKFGQKKGAVEVNFRMDQKEG